MRDNQKNLIGNFNADCLKWNMQYPVKKAKSGSHI